MTEQRITELEARLRRIEDERAIERMIASYGPLVDAGEADAVAAMWAPDGVYDVENWLMTGPDDVAAMVRSSGHQDFITTGCTHFLSPAVVTIQGNQAVAVCESTLLLRRATSYEAIRAGVSHFHLRRAAEAAHGWQIVKRITRLLDGTEPPRKLLSDGVAGRIPN
ncbi:nuclear transport factor 2 family protein [Mycolicibacterium sp. lyk4-40-TYG-92]|uniref:nuclear transport factor 2 family protein n=1 Tax=Mycolicibacterium sp. lyk4-40-TYG-92 TaxID=3040295 RepID=UPI00254D4227|nr:nuclear transport factor 2 family protein [Mycolicibacterium sp. lyk4-40-TYG-92]